MEKEQNPQECHCGCHKGEIGEPKQDIRNEVSGACGCASDNHMKKAGDCCHKKEAEKEEHACCHEPVETHACCSEHFAKEAHACCSEKHDEKPLHSCCTETSVEEIPHSCCSSKAAEETHACCHEKEEEHGCCHKKEETHASCRCNHEEKKTGRQKLFGKNAHDDGETGNCCGMDHHYDDEPENCCGMDHKHEEESGNCCGMDHKHDEGGNCCGMDHATGKKGKRVNTSLVYLLVSLVALIVSLCDPWRNLPAWVGLFDFGWVSIVLCGIPIYRGAFKNLKRGKITSALLISIAMTASIVMGVLNAFGVLQGHIGHSENYFFAAGEIAFLMALGSMIENLTVKKSRSAVKTLLSLKPHTAWVWQGAEYIETPIDRVKVGDRVLLKPNEVVSVDGTVLEGKSAVNEANITGESLPREKKAGDPVYAGTTNTSGALTVEVTAKNEESTVSRLIDYIREAEKKKAPIVKLADKWAGVIVPGAVVVSVIVFFIAWLAMAQQPLEALQRAITILVVVCPCALALATPIAISAGIGNLSRRGVLVKSGTALEAMAHVKAIAFDKTGTLTKGELAVQKVTANGISEEELLYFAATAESQSEHPIAKAIINRAGRIGTPENTRSAVAEGVYATVDGKEVAVIKYGLLSEEDKAAFPAEGAYTTVAVRIDGQTKGILQIADTVREEGKETLARLKEFGYETVMLTGDNHTVAEEIGRKLGVTAVKSELLPEEKVGAIEGLKSEGKRVMMIGDGVNDAPAMAASDCSAAMGAMGNSVAIETADVSLLHSDLSLLPHMLKLSKRTLNVIRTNITLSLCISFAAIFLSAFGLLNAVTGALVHNASSVLVCCNSALLLLYGRKQQASAEKK